MEEAKRERSRKAGTTTRRVKELQNAVKNEASPTEIKEKISTVKYTFEELGELQDKVLELIDPTDTTAIATDIKWYDSYDDKVNKGIIDARGFIRHGEEATRNELPVKLAKLKLPEFESDSKK